MGVTLREGDREYYYAALDRHFPGLKQQYIRRYGNAYILPSPDEARLMQLLRGTCRRYAMMYEPDEIFAYLNEMPEEYTQMTLF